MPEHYTPGASDVPDESDELDLTVKADDDADRHILGAIARVEELLEQLDQDGVEDEEGDCDEDTVRRLEELTAPDEAPLEWRSLHDRVRRGTLTWPAFWDRPQDHPGGTDLMRKVMFGSARDITAQLAALEGDLASQAGEQQEPGESEGRGRSAR